MKPSHISAQDFKLLKSEHQIQTETRNYLLSKGYFVQRINSGQIPWYDKNGIKRRVILAEKGTGDLLIGIPMNGVWAMGWIEVKAAKGKLTIHQEMFKKDMEEKGILYIIARSVEDAERGINDYVERLRSV